MFHLSTSDIALQFSAWIFTYVLHSTIIIVLLWGWIKMRPVMSIYLKEILLKTALILGLCTASLQLYGSWGWANTTVILANSTPAQIPQDAAQKQVVQAESLTSQTEENPLVTRPSLTIHWYEALTLSWLVIVLWLCIRLTWRKQRFLRSLIFVSAPDHSLDNILKSLCSKIRLSQQVRLCLVSNTLSPLVLNRNTIVVPVKALELLTAEEQKSMLAHELAHLQRRDDLWLKFYQALHILLFFQPLNRWVLRQIHEVTEQICDVKATQVTQNNQALAKCLVEVASWLTSQPRWVVSMASRQKPLTTRVTQLLNNQTMKHSTKSRLLTPLSMASIIGLVGLVAIFTLPGIHFSWAQAIKKNAEVKSFKAYTLNVTAESKGRYHQAIVIKNPQGKISEFYVDDKKYAAQDLGKFSFINQALERREVHMHSKKALMEGYKKLEMAESKQKKAFEKAYVAAQKMKDEKAKEKRLKEIKLEIQKAQESFRQKKMQLEKDIFKKMKKK